MQPRRHISKMHSYIGSQSNAVVWREGVCRDENPVMTVPIKRRINNELSQSHQWARIPSKNRSILVIGTGQKFLTRVGSIFCGSDQVVSCLRAHLYSILNLLWLKNSSLGLHTILYFLTLVTPNTFQSTKLLTSSPEKSQFIKKRGRYLGIWGSRVWTPARQPLTPGGQTAK